MLILMVLGWMLTAEKNGNSRHTSLEGFHGSTDYCPASYLGVIDETFR